MNRDLPFRIGIVYFFHNNVMSFPVPPPTRTRERDDERVVKMKKRMAIYPGSFDPITNGHVDVVHRASKIFDHIVLAIVHNPSKKSLFTVEERERMIREVFKSDRKVSVESFSGLLSEFVEKKRIYTVIRGLRVVTDFDYELSLALMNQKLNPKLETLFFMTNEKFLFISSSLIKEVAQFGGDAAGYVPALVGRKLAEKFGAKR